MVNWLIEEKAGNIKQERNSVQQQTLDNNMIIIGIGIMGKIENMWDIVREICCKMWDWCIKSKNNII